MIELRGVTKTYPGAAGPSVRGIDLVMPEAAFVVVVGPSGCGKSTLLRMIAGLEAVTSGDVLIGGVRVNDREPKDRGCAMVFQTYALYPHMSVAQNIGYPLRVAGVKRAERDARVQEVAKSLALDTMLDRRPGQLSGGQRQRVAMGRAMVRRPRVFLFDEPLSNLDATLRVQMRAELRRLHDSLGVTSVLVTHDQIEAMTLADVMVVMNAGRIEQSGPPREVYERPQSRFVASFLGSPAMNLVAGRVADEGTSILVGDGLAVRLPGRLDPGRAVLLGIRPEHVTEGPLDAVCDLIEDLGISRLVHARTSGLTLLVHVPAERSIARGDRIGLALPADRLHVFDASGHRRLTPEPRHAVEPATA